MPGSCRSWLILALCMAVGSLARWKRDGAARLFRELRWVALAAVAGGIAAPLLALGPGAWGMTAASVLALWIVLALLRDLVRRVPDGRVWRLPASYLGMFFAHVGFAVALVGAVGATLLATERDLRVEVGERVEVGGFEITFSAIDRVRGPNYVAEQARFSVRAQGGGRPFELFPEKRRYPVRNNVMTEAAIRPGFWRDLYVALGEPLPTEAGAPVAWAVRVHSKPLVRWIWGGAALMALGGFVALLDKRYRRVRRSAQSEPEQAPAAVAGEAIA
jgi:cytochrome c-type biogenesis protein CcmF